MYCGRIWVEVGPAAIAVGSGWAPVLSGNVWLPERFQSAKEALAYGKKMEGKQTMQNSTMLPNRKPTSKGGKKGGRKGC